MTNRFCLVGCDDREQRVAHVLAVYHNIEVVYDSFVILRKNLTNTRIFFFF